MTGNGTPNSSVAAEIEEFKEVARRVSNWGRWGSDDELGTLNHITPEVTVAAAGAVRRGVSFSLSVPFDSDGPQDPAGFRPNPVHLMQLDGGDVDLARRLGDWGGTTAQMSGRLERLGSIRINDDYIMMNLQAATQWDALAHICYDGLMYNGVPADQVTSFGARRDGIDKVAMHGQVATRGVLLDVARYRGVDHLPERDVVTPDELDEVARAQGVEVRQGDVVVVRTGWWREFLRSRDASRWGSRRPGLSWRCAEWFHDRDVAAVACDNSGVETSAGELEGVKLPLHMLALRDMGMMLGEFWDTEALADDCVEDKTYEFLVVAAPLLITGAVGSPVNPIAIK